MVASANQPSGTDLRIGCPEGPGRKIPPLSWNPAEGDTAQHYFSKLEKRAPAP